MNEKYYFPKYIHNHVMTKGLYWYEYIIIAIVSIIIFASNISVGGVISSVFTAFFIYIFLVRLDERVNLLKRLRFYIQFFSSKKYEKLDLRRRRNVSKKQKKID